LGNKQPTAVIATKTAPSASSHFFLVLIPHRIYDAFVIVQIVMATAFIDQVNQLNNSSCQWYSGVQLTLLQCCCS
jgi:hypothetical protein